MSAYTDYQAQQIERAKTFAEIRRIEERLSRIPQDTTEPKRGGAWPFRSLTRLRRATVSNADAA